MGNSMLKYKIFESKTGSLYYNDTYNKLFWVFKKFKQPVNVEIIKDVKVSLKHNIIVELFTGIYKEVSNNNIEHSSNIVQFIISYNGISFCKYVEFVNPLENYNWYNIYKSRNQIINYSLSVN